MSGTLIRSEFVPFNGSQHTTKDFDCGKKPLNNYLQLSAKKHMAANLSRTFVVPYTLSNKESKARIAAFYTLVNNSVEANTLPKNKKLAHYPVPIILIGQLAVDKQFRGQGLGAKTLITALRHAYNISAMPAGIPSYGVVLDVLDEDAKAFYNAFDFFIEISPHKLFAPMTSLKEV
jgi:GNAT superfamily N-acetyltransferase